MKTLHTFNIEITDTFGDEANYSWVRRYQVKAASFKAAARKLASLYGCAGWRCAGNYGNFADYNLSGSCVCAFITLSE